VHDGGVVEGGSDPAQKEDFDEFHTFAKGGCFGHPVAQAPDFGSHDGGAIEVAIEKFADGNSEELPEAEGLKEDGERFQAGAEPDVGVPIDAGADEHDFVRVGVAPVA
jgi:hypothetical protein